MPRASWSGIWRPRPRAPRSERSRRPHTAPPRVSNDAAGMLLAYAKALVWAVWAKHRTLESAVAVLAQTSLLVTGWHGSRCVAMLRVLSDGVYRALVEDVIVHPDYQGHGWGRRIV